MRPASISTVHAASAGSLRSLWSVQTHGRSSNRKTYLDSRPASNRPLQLHQRAADLVADGGAALLVVGDGHGCDGGMVTTGTTAAVEQATATRAGGGCHRRGMTTASAKETASGMVGPGGGGGGDGSGAREAMHFGGGWLFKFVGSCWIAVFTKIACSTKYVDVIIEVLVQVDLLWLICTLMRLVNMSNVTAHDITHKRGW